ncbi:MAG: succinate dehydrogenase [Anaerolineae bacterium]|nr:succinate dehydrogenase [Anaerolineae bacterium]
MAAETGAPARRVNINNFETNVWRYMRLSGLLIIPLLLGHLLILHLINSVFDVNYEWVIEYRWGLIGWRIYDAFLLWFAGLHGFLGVRCVIRDYVHDAQVRRVIMVVMAMVVIFLFLLGTVALIGAPFEPVEIPVVP